jgi:Tol biopolymer transport system component
MSSSLRLIAAAAAILAAGCGSQPQPVAQKLQDAPQGQIAFRRYLDAAQTQGALFIVNADGSGERQLTQPPAGVNDDQPDFSQDGTQIAFERCRHDASCTTMVMPASGGTPTEVRVRCRKGPVCERTTPAWGPGHQLIVNVFEGRERQLGDDVWIERASVVSVDLDTGSRRTLVARDHWEGDTHDPAISADGSTIVYQQWNSPRSRPANAMALFAADAHGGHERRITPWALEAGDHPVFSPAGDRVLFHSYVRDGDARQSDYWTVHPDGTGLRRLTHFKAPTELLSASYSPDGKWIVHAATGTAGNADLFIMRADGTDRRPLTRTKLWDSAPDWRFEP